MNGCSTGYVAGQRYCNDEDLAGGNEMSEYEPAGVSNRYAGCASSVRFCARHRTTSLFGDQSYRQRSVIRRAKDGCRLCVGVLYGIKRRNEPLPIGFRQSDQDAARGQAWFRPILAHRALIDKYQHDGRVWMQFGHGGTNHDCVGLH